MSSSLRGQTKLSESRHRHKVRGGEAARMCDHRGGATVKSSIRQVDIGQDEY